MKKLFVVAVILCLAGIAHALILPNGWDGEKWIFNNQRCDPWTPNPENAKDPLLVGVTAFEFQMITEDYDFLAIAFPTGFGLDGLIFDILDENGHAGIAMTGNPQSMADWYIFNPPVRWFRISGFNLSFDPAVPADQDIFPWWLRFSPCPLSPLPGVSYSVKPIVPEPATILLLSLGIVALRKK